jgi:FKBP-type peptidyl-prolyl cis-trans isomerase SlyD
MRIERGKVVSLSYDLRDCDGRALDDEGSGMAYLHGYGGIFPKVAAALEGQAVGHKVMVTLEPEDAFGEYDAELLRVEPRESFPDTLEIGMRFEGIPGDSEDEALIYTVTDIAADKVVVDGNHPLAGERLWFTCAVTAVRDATPEELEHGHAHDDALTIQTPPSEARS